MAFVTYQRVRKVQRNRDGTGISNYELWGVLSSLIITPIMIIVYFALGTFTLITKSIKESGFTYVLGVMHISVLWLALLLLLSSVTQNAFNNNSQNLWRDVSQLSWDGNDSSLFQVREGRRPEYVRRPAGLTDAALPSQATWVLGYVLLCFYVLLFLAFFILKGTLKRLDLGSEHGRTGGVVKGEEAV